MCWIERARTCCAEERSRVVAERESFEAFGRRVASVEASATPSPVTDGGTRVAGPSTSGDGLRRIRVAYRETVMATDHYDSDYGESLADSLAVEFGDAVADAVMEGDRLTPQLRRRLLSACGAARSNRQSFLRVLDREAEELATTRRRLDAVEAELSAAAVEYPSQASFEDLQAAWERLDDLVADCESVLADRQSTLQDGFEWDHDPDLPSYHEYLYDPLEPTYPVLAETVALTEEVRAARDDVAAALAR